MGNEYMFGKSILVAPIATAQYTPEKIVRSNEQTGWDRKEGDNKNTNSGVDFTKPKSTKVYLPAETTWYDFWTNEKINGGKEITKETTIDMIPLYIKAGSIIPFGPKVQFATEKRWDNLEIRVYPGANGEFTLYEDENDNYNYEKGAYSTITFSWNNAKKVLTIQDRKGSFTGMLSERTFNVQLIGSEKNAKSVTYKGNKVVVKF